MFLSVLTQKHPKQELFLLLDRDHPGINIHGVLVIIPETIVISGLGFLS